MQDDLVFAVAIEIADRGIVRRVARRRLQRDREIRHTRRIRLSGKTRAVLSLDRIFDWPHEPSVRLFRRRIGIRKTRRVPQRLRVQFHRLAAISRAIHIERHTLRIRPEQPPAHKNFPIALRKRHHAAPEVLHLTLRVRGAHRKNDRP